MMLAKLKDKLSFIQSELKDQVSYIGLRWVGTNTTALSVRNGLVEKSFNGMDNGIMLEVVAQGQLCYGATQDLSNTSLKTLAQNLLQSAQHIHRKNLTKFSNNFRPSAVKGEYIEKHMLKDASFIKELSESLINSVNEMEVSDKIVNRQGYVNIVDTDSLYINTLGSEIYQQYSPFMLDLAATAQDDKDTQKRSLGMLCGQSDSNVLMESFKHNRPKTLGDEALELLNAPNCPNGKLDLVLTPTQLYLQLHESIGHPLELDRILGDERNYAGWSFVRPEDFGILKYGNDCLNVVFEPKNEFEVASYGYDDTGIKAEKQYLIKDGILRNGIGGVESQTRSGLGGIASTRACSWNRAPIDRMANINILPGQKSMKEMVSSIENGVIMDTNKSWSIDDYRNKFQFGCEQGKLVRDGEIVGIVKNPNYRGVTIPFWHALDMVGDESTSKIWGSFFCGKGEPNQVINVGHATPTCLFRDIDVFSGEE